MRMDTPTSLIPAFFATLWQGCFSPHEDVDTCDHFCDQGKWGRIVVEQCGTTGCLTAPVLLTVPIVKSQKLLCRQSRPGKSPMISCA